MTLACFMALEVIPTLKLTDQGLIDVEQFKRDRRFQVQGTVAWMPSIFGLTMAGAVVNHLVGRELKPAATDAGGRADATPDTTAITVLPCRTPAEVGARIAARRDRTACRR